MAGNLGVNMLYKSKCGICSAYNIHRDVPERCHICEESKEFKVETLVIGIVGMGTVGRAVDAGFSTHAEMRCYDIDKERCIDSLEDTLDSDFLFICVPTPANEAGGVELGHVHEIMEHFRDRPLSRHPFLILKSTVPIGTTGGLMSEYNYPLVYCPEFLRGDHAIHDFLTLTKVIIGGNRQEASQVGRLFQLRFYASVYFMTPQQAEFTKLAINAFFATKVSLMNEFHLLAEQLGIKWDQFLPGFLSDPRISVSHTEVPGPDGKVGFGGTCLPKDLQTLRQAMLANGVRPTVLDAVAEQNWMVRGE